MELFRLLGTVAIDNLNAIAGLDETQKKAKTTAQKMSAHFKNIGDKSIQLGNKLKWVSVGAGSALGSMVKYASDAEEAQNKVDVAFGKSSKEVEKFASTSLKQFGIASGSAMDMAALFGDMGTSMGLSQKESAKMSTSLVGLAGDLASFKNIGIDQATTALNGIFTGETESLKTLGIVMTQTNLDAFALANGFGKTTSEMTQSELVALRYAYVMDKTKNAQGDFARTGDSTANQLRKFKEGLKEVSANFGELLLPYVSKAVGVINKFVGAISKAPAPVKAVAVGFMGLLAVASPVLIIFGKTMQAIGQITSALTNVNSRFRITTSSIKTYTSAVLNSALTTVKDTAVKAVNAVATSKVGNAAKGAAVKVIAFANAHKVAMLAAFGLAAPIIALAGYMLTTGASAEETAANITNFANRLAGMITDFANNLPALIDAVLPAITNAIQSIVASLPTLIPVLIQAGINLFMALVNSLNEIIPPLVAALTKAVRAIVQALPVLIPALIQAGVTLFMALVKALPIVIGELVKALPKIVKAVKKGLGDGLSRVWDSIKKTASKKWNDIKEKITSPITKAKEKIKGIIDKIKGYFPFKVGKIFSSLKLPKISVTKGEAPFGIGGKGSLPKFHVKWNAQGAIFDKPTIFATPQGLQGVGEAGKEAVTPISKLQGYVTNAVAEQNRLLLEALREMEASRVYTFNITSELDGKKIAFATAKYAKEELNKLQARADRLQGVRT